MSLHSRLNDELIEMSKPLSLMDCALTEATCRERGRCTGHRVQKVDVSSHKAEDLLGLLGEDEQVELNPAEGLDEDEAIPTRRINLSAQIRNELRAELRAKIREYCGQAAPTSASASPVQAYKDGYAAGRNAHMNPVAKAKQG